MGNYSLSSVERRRQSVDSLRKLSEEKDRNFPRMDRPCGTPGAVYSIFMDDGRLGCVVDLPFDVEDAIPAEAVDTMKKALHDAMLPVIEQFYRDVWDGTIAGKIIDGDSEPMPKRWELLFTKWIKRCFDRDEHPMLDGREIWNIYQLPERYDWRRK